MDNRVGGECIRDVEEIRKVGMVPVNSIEIGIHGFFVEQDVRGNVTIVFSCRITNSCFYPKLE